MEQPSNPTLTEFISYNNWANQKVLEACRNLSEDQLASRTPGAYGSIWETLEHLIRAEAGYVKSLTGERPQPAFKWEDKPGVAEMMAYSLDVAKALEAAAQRVPITAQIDQEIDGYLHRYQALALYIQIIDHGIEHRTNITTILNQGIQPPPDVDGWEYLLSHPDRLEPK